MTAVRLTPRGVGMLGIGAVGVVSGVIIASTPVVQVSALLVLVVVVGVGQLVLAELQARRGGLHLSRRVDPHPVTAGGQATVHVELTSPSRSHRVDRLGVSERAARELSGAGPLRARVRRSPDHLTLEYGILAGRRGRWSVGPLEVHRADLFGTARWRGPLGAPRLVAVRPRTTDLTMPDALPATDVDRATLGAYTPAPEDAALRDYQTGDDLRRVHWRSSARRGSLVVRQDERSGRRPASVLLDLPDEPEGLEWTVSTGASMALGLLAAGHHVRVLSGEDANPAEAGRHHRPDCRDARSEVLDQMIDLRSPRTPAERDRWLRHALTVLTSEAGGAELVFAVLGSLDAGSLATLARVGQASHGWAMIRHDEDAASVASTTEGLRRAGWTVCRVEVGEPVERAWVRLLHSDHRLGARR